MKNFIIIVCSLLQIQLAVLGQNRVFPTIGDICPPFTLIDVKGYERDVLSNTDFLGKKWLILDFWSKTCKTCLTEFPKIDKLQTSFKNEVQFVLVGDNSQKYNKGIEELYEGIRVKENLSLTVAFDSTLRNSFRFRVIPHLVIVDPAGIIYAITGAKDLTPEKLRALVSGEKPEFNLKLE